jgi:hypothetical protein
MAFIRLVGERLVEEYVTLLKDGHKENCLWRNRSCDGTFIMSFFSFLASFFLTLHRHHPTPAIEQYRYGYIWSPGPIFEAGGYER